MSLFWFSKDKHKELRLYLRRELGIKTSNPELYLEALTHKSAIKNDGRVIHGNERLEYLGDAILGAVVTEYLFALYPQKDEGFLSKMRARIVSRKNLNILAHKIELPEIFKVSEKALLNQKFLHGNAFEALLGALYLDKGYRNSSSIITRAILQKHMDIQTIEQDGLDAKSTLYEWSQKHGKTLSFTVSEDNLPGRTTLYIAQVHIDHTAWAKGAGDTKKDAEQTAAQNTLEDNGFIALNKQLSSDGGY